MTETEFGFNFRSSNSISVINSDSRSKIRRKRTARLHRSVFQKIAEFHEQPRARPEGRNGLPGSLHQIVGNGAGLFEPMECWISEFPLIAVASIGSVKNVVDDLERETDAVAKSGNVLQFFCPRQWPDRLQSKPIR